MLVNVSLPTSKGKDVDKITLYKDSESRFMVIVGTTFKGLAGKVLIGLLLPH